MENKDFEDIDTEITELKPKPWLGVFALIFLLGFAIIFLVSIAFLFQV